MTDHKLVINGDDEWQALNGQSIGNSVVYVTDCGDLHPYSNGPVFTGAKIVIIRGCDKNFVYYWVNSSRFPQAEEVYILCHPCEPAVLHRFRKGTIYLVDWYQNYKNRWAEERESLVIVKSEETLDKFEKYVNETAIILPKFV